MRSSPLTRRSSLPTKGCWNCFASTAVRVLAFTARRPQDGGGLLASLERSAHEGAEVLVVPKISLWWNEEFNALQPCIRDRFQEITSTEACDLYDIRRRPVELEQESTNGRGPSAVSEDSAALRADRLLPPAVPPDSRRTTSGGARASRSGATSSNARPLFDGHYQPRLPSNLGFYDLRLPETREAQAELARAHGITGFCYYHYWFSGKRLLERPFEEVLASGRPDFPFCLCWANEPWSRRWDGQEQEVLQPQTLQRGGRPPAHRLAPSGLTRRARDPRRGQAALPRLPGPRTAGPGPDGRDLAAKRHAKRDFPESISCPSRPVGTKAGTRASSASTGRCSSSPSSRSSGGSRGSRSGPATARGL